MKSRAVTFFFLSAVLFATGASAAEITLYGAGSLKGAMSEIIAAYTKQTGVAVKSDFGPSGTLRQRIEKGEPVDVFASADMEHPNKLVAGGRSEKVTHFTSNKLCALAKPEVGLTTANFLEKALDPAIRLGTSTPGSDPAGDYTLKVFAKAESQKAGTEAALKAKALQLVGGPKSEPVPAGKAPMPYQFEAGKADMFIYYCTGGKLAADAGIKLTMVSLPAELEQGADYGLTVMKGAPTEASQLAQYILSPEGQAILTKWGFVSPSAK